ncbi:MAG: NAD(P)/FAD-dependent oxidoreductase [Desulfocucumaceae bacterium]
MIRVSGIRLSLEEDEQYILTKTCKKLRVKESQIIGFRIFRQSIDARKSSMIYLVYTVDVELKNEKHIISSIKDKDVTVTPDMEYRFVQPGDKILNSRPVVVGTGPAGLFAGLLLAQAGYRPILLERGADVDTRTGIVRSFWETGRLDKECNVQFGEGGAGAFSDGKLTTLIKDRRCRKIIEEMVLAGAPAEIAYSYKPHVGTDILKTVVKNIRQKIVHHGGEVRFYSRVTDIVTEENALAGVVINGAGRLDAQAMILAIGHSARDTFAMLCNRGVAMTPKAFSIGVRIEHPQELIDRAQYKQFAGHKRLGPAEYKLAYHSPGGRSAYTFCMCPGGTVVSAASEEGCVVTNGMSQYARSEKNANSALLVGVTPDDFGSTHPLAGVEFQRNWEKRAFDLGGRNYGAPVQLVGDFLEDRPSKTLGGVRPSYTGPVVPAELKKCLPDYVISTMREAIPHFDRKLEGFALADAVLTGVETRTSSPVRIVRDNDCRSSIAGLYPAGEGAGYAGGIVSAAVDGMRVAERIIMKYKPLAHQPGNMAVSAKGGGDIG